MAKFQLTISSDYVSDWGAYEGVREVLQNALDGRDSGHPMHVNYNKTSGMLVVANFGVRLERSVWLLGCTSKNVADSDARGHFGEGLKLGALALVRSGRKLRIVNDDEDWTCTLEASRAFPDQRVLTISTRKRPDPLGSFSVQIECTSQEWEQYRDCFLDLKPAVTRIQTPDADILTDPVEKGRVYVKGILVETKPDLYAGYNFTGSSVRTDRDRRTVNSFDFSWNVGTAWINALTGRFNALTGRFGDSCITGADFLRLLETGTPDAKAAGDRYCPAEGITAVYNAWVAAYGNGVIPVTDAAGVKEAGHYGKVGRPGSAAVCAFFAEHPDLSLDELRSQRRGDVVETFSFDQLDHEEQAVYQAALEAVGPSLRELGINPVASRLQVVRFQTEDLRGLWRDRGIFVARKTLADLPGFLQVLVHEIAHDFGGDGDVAHERAEGRIFSHIVARLATENPLVPALAAA